MKRHQRRQRRVSPPSSERPLFDFCLRGSADLRNRRSCDVLLALRAADGFIHHFFETLNRDIQNWGWVQASNYLRDLHVLLD